MIFQKCLASLSQERSWSKLEGDILNITYTKSHDLAI